ncbi:hypothetical protein QJS66_20970 [Kocuria rhizophila]|nr:hypothetical protein QJS66_20970 [Kocuria rhizophila]
MLRHIRPGDAVDVVHHADGVGRAWPPGRPLGHGRRGPRRPRPEATSLLARRDGHGLRPGGAGRSTGDGSGLPR